MKPFPIIFGLVLTVAVLSALLFKACTAKPLPANPFIQRGYDSAKREDSPVIARWEDTSRALHLVINDMQARQQADKQDLQSRAGDISRNLIGLDQAKIVHDTVKILMFADTLEAQVKSGIPAVKGYVQLSDSLVSACVARGQVQDSIIARLTRLNRVADTTITRQRLYYEILHKDNATKTAQLRIYKPVAIGGTAIIIAAIVLKFIAH